MFLYTSRILQGQSLLRNAAKSIFNPTNLGCRLYATTSADLGVEESSTFPQVFLQSHDSTQSIFADFKPERLQILRNERPTKPPPSSSLVFGHTFVSFGLSLFPVP